MEKKSEEYILFFMSLNLPAHLPTFDLIVLLSILTGTRTKVNFDRKIWEKRRD